MKKSSSATANPVLHHLSWTSAASRVIFQFDPNVPVALEVGNIDKVGEALARAPGTVNLSVCVNNNPYWDNYYSNKEEAIKEEAKSYEKVKQLFKFLNSYPRVQNVKLTFKGPLRSDSNCIIEALRENTTIRSLDLSDCELASSARLPISHILENTNLEALFLKNHELKDFGVQELCTTLSSNQTLQTLDLSQTPERPALYEYKITTKVNVNRLTSESAGHLGNVLSKNKTLQILDLSGNKIGFEGLRYLTEGLTRNSTLTTLNLSYNEIILNRIDDTPIRETELVSALRKSTLRALDLSYNTFDRGSATIIADMLSENSNLQSLNLEACKIDLQGIAELSTALKQNSTLSELNLAQNKIENEGAIKLAEMLRVNKGLKTLDLKGTHIGTDGIIHLVWPLYQNDTLECLDLSCEDYGKKALEELAKLELHNPKLKIIVDDNYREAINQSKNKFQAPAPRRSPIL